MKKGYPMLIFTMLLSCLVFCNAVHAYGLPQPPSVMLNITVYVTEGDKNFHRSGCGLLYGRQISGIPLGQAYKEGYTPCDHCKPPQIQKEP